MQGIRQATESDAEFLVPLMAESSGGVWPAVWKALAAAHETVPAAAVRYLTDRANQLSVYNTVVAESSGGRLGAMTCYRERAAAPATDQAPGDPRLPPELAAALQPYRELSDPHSLFIAELCLLPAARGQGFGTRLLAHARKLAVERDLARVTLRVFAANAGALRLYERSGFRVVDRRATVAHPDIQVAGEVLSMVCTL